MLQKTNDILIALDEAMKERRVKVPLLSKQTGIPKDRIYKWFQQNNSPKSEDSIKIWAWITGEKSNIPGSPPAAGLKRLSECEAWISVLRDTVVETIHAASGENRAVILKKLERAKDDVLRISSGA